MSFGIAAIFYLTACSSQRVFKCGDMNEVGGDREKEKNFM
jgi:hypothetical protein